MQWKLCLPVGKCLPLKQHAPKGIFLVTRAGEMDLYPTRPKHNSNLATHFSFGIKKQNKKQTNVIDIAICMDVLAGKFVDFRACSLELEATQRDR